MKYIYVLFEFKHKKLFTSHRGYLLDTTLPRTHTQIRTPTVVQGLGGGGGGWNLYPEFLICCCILKRFYLYWKAFDLFNKMKYILWVVALLKACDVTNNGRHLGCNLGLYRELEIRLKCEKWYFFCALHKNNP